MTAMSFEVERMEIVPTRTSTSHTTFRGWARAWVVAAAVALLSAPALAGALDKGTSASMSSEQVRVVQRALSDKGYAIEVTGNWDDGTRAALMNFQASRHLPQTGELDHSTSTALGVDPAGATSVSGKARAADRNPDPAVDCIMNSTIDCRPGA